MATDNKPAAETAVTETPTAEAEAANVIVKFVKGWGIYNAGETAGFPPDRAQWLLANKLAEKA